MDETAMNRKMFEGFEPMAKALGVTVVPVHRQYPRDLMVQLLSALGRSPKFIRWLATMAPEAPATIEQLPQSEGGIGDGYNYLAEHPDQLPPPEPTPMQPGPEVKVSDAPADAGLPPGVGCYIAPPDEPAPDVAATEPVAATADES